MPCDVVAEGGAQHGIALERVARLVQVAGQLVDPQPSLFAMRQLGDVAVDGLPCFHKLIDAVKSRGEHRREREIGIR